MATMSNQWLLIAANGLQHVIFLPERGLHILSKDCACGTERADRGVVLHAVLTAASRKQERSH